MAVKHNTDRVRKSAANLKKSYTAASRDTVEASAKKCVENIQALIPPPKGAGVFPGYAATGTLRRAIEATEPKQIGPIWRSTVRVNPDSDAAVYAHVHEYGMTIKAKTKPYLVFYIPGVGWRRSRQVNIRAKGYFSRGVRESRSQLRQRIESIFSRALNKYLGR